ncbi:MAG: hypothetical protein N0C84_02685, partial [Candidatus Thiodiazotropha taylori]|nr:hypothetical protein [Candidatus Thiodiazotropha taylori]MCW4255354.1 hypothetical protein [Candidatus Thiodiazotropha taylori]
MSVDELDTRLLGHLSLLYGEQQAATLLPKLHELIGRHIEVRQGKRLEIPRWDEKDSVLIGYGDSIQYPGMTPLASLKQFLDRRLNGVFSMV